MTELEHKGVLTRGGPTTLTAWLKTSRSIKLPVAAPSAVDLLVQTRRESTR